MAHQNSPLMVAAQQRLAADGAIACFSSNLFQLSLNADRAPQLKANVGLLLLENWNLTLSRTSNKNGYAPTSILTFDFSYRFGRFLFTHASANAANVFDARQPSNPSAFTAEGNPNS